MREPTTSTLSSSESGSPAFPRTASRPAPGWLFAATIFLSAFLLFQVQPLIAKAILPWFGGSAAVWTTCMLFFQLVLLLGYGYAHGNSSRLRARPAGVVHVVLLLASAFVLPIIPSPWWKPVDGSLPMWRILGLLSATVGLPYLVLAATSPLLQSWYARAKGGGLPYRFFALSNFASMLALLSYPILVEPRLSLRHQAWAWSVGYGVFALLCGYLAWASRGFAAAYTAVAEPADDAAPTWRERAIWIALGACPSALLLGVTNHITQNIAAIPFLWIIPLSLYLLSFILTFESNRWYHRRIFLGFFAVAISSMGYALGGNSEITKVAVSLPLFTISLFVCCMVCHGELAQRRPSSRHLTSFYLMISVGGALGGLFVAAFAPVVFPALFEFPITIILTALLIIGLLYQEHEGKPMDWKILLAGSLTVTAALAVYMVREERAYLGGARLLTRNFYGALRVSDDLDDGIRQLVHGTINHGAQFLAPAKSHEPITYYAPTSGIGLTMTELHKQPAPVRLGVIGLGTGTMAAWLNLNDSVRFYEINPKDVEIARSQFTYLKDAYGPVEIALGDARLSMEREASQGFDVLVVDAFSGDSIPVHLLTREAFGIYWRHLKPDGVLAVHISNKYLNLGPPVAALAPEFGKGAALVDVDRDDDTQTFGSDWVLITSRPGFYQLPWLSKPENKIAPIAGLRPWSDDFSNLWQILR